jgi:2-dehydro-3-deoxyphosphogluconate aldolase / (4S)-4-hydroxy-2-oxoglutarate aldolase
VFGDAGVLSDAVVRAKGSFMNAAPAPSTHGGPFATLLNAARVIPVLTIERREDAVPLARALVAGGVTMLEVTLRTPVAIEAAKAIIAEVPEAIVGIGTILNPNDLARAQALGAKFGISPGGTPDLLKAAAASGLPFAPGIATSSDLMQALAHGFGLVKFFPAEQSGGIKALRALAGPFPDMRFCPTGGIGEANAASWLTEPNVVAVGGSWLCPASDIRSGNWAGITAICNRAMKLLKPA